MNYIEQFMKDNDIKIDEEFYVIDENGTKIGGLISIIFYFDKNMRLNMKLVESDCRDVFRGLMSGKCKIEKIPKKPKSVWDLKEGDEYYYITLLGYVEEENEPYYLGVYEYNSVANHIETIYQLGYGTINEKLKNKYTKS